MTDINDQSIDDALEVSVRASNSLKANGVRTVGQLMELTKMQVMAWKGTGIRTWVEIAEVQSAILNNQRRAERPKAFADAIAIVNHLMLADPRLRVMIHGSGLLLPVRLLALRPDHQSPAAMPEEYG